MKKFPKLKRLGDSVNDGILESGDEYLHVQEKLDGANFRFGLERNLDDEYHTEGRDLVFGSRNVQYKNEKDVDDTFQHAIDYVRDRANVARMMMLDDELGPLTFFGEAMHSHTIDYDWENTPPFVGFGIYSEKFDKFLDKRSMEMDFESIGFETPKEHSLDVVKDGFDCPDSEYYDGPAEGVVIWNSMTGQRAKIRGEKFKEAHFGAKDGGGSEDYSPAGSIVLANQFATEHRVLKMIHKYEDRGINIHMGVMEELWRDVFDDIIEEEYENIFLGNHTIDTKDFRSEVASNTASVLQTYLNRPDDSVLNETPA